MHAGVSPPRSLGDPTVIIAHPGAEVPITMFSGEGDSRGGSLVPTMYCPVK